MPRITGQKTELNGQSFKSNTCFNVSSVRCHWSRAWCFYQELVKINNFQPMLKNNMLKSNFHTKLIISSFFLSKDSFF